MYDRGLIPLQLMRVAVCLAAVAGTRAQGELPNPVLQTVFPAGGAAGETFDVTVSGSALDGLVTLHCKVPGIRFKQHDDEPNRFRVTLPPDTPPGLVDVRAVGANGLSSPRPFLIGNRSERLEVEPNESLDSAQTAQVCGVIHGRIEKGGDQDHFKFAAERGQRVIIECWADRIDSRLRAVLEVFAEDGRRLAVNRGYFGIDPLIDFRVPSDGSYLVKIHDLIYAGSQEHYYRLDIDTGPRVAFAFPCVVQRGRASRVSLYGWNLNPGDSGQTGFDRVEVDLSPQLTISTWPLPVRLEPAQVAVEGFPYYFPGGHAPVVIGVTDVPVTRDNAENHSPGTAQEISVPCEVSGQLEAGDERDWFAIQAKRGEVLYFETLANRINSPVDLDLSVLDASGHRQLAQFSDEVSSVGGQVLPSSHLDPVGRWVVPADGRYLVVVRNLIGGLNRNAGRIYRLGVRREEPALQLVVVPQRADPAALNVARGGRAAVDVRAFRRRGLNGSIRVAARDLPDGIVCPDVWLGPGVDRATMVVSAERDAVPLVAELKLSGFADLAAESAARGGTVVRTGRPNGWGRLTTDFPLAVAGEAPLQITAAGDETRDHELYGELQVRYSPGGILDVAVYVARRDSGDASPIKITGVGLPEMIRNRTATIPAGEDKGYVSFYLPPALPVGTYSLAIRAETTRPVPDSQKTETITVFSNPVNFEVHPPAFRLEVDTSAPRRIRRGQIVQVDYSATRLNGFINKIHTELASPGRVTKVVGLRGRGVTFVGQTETGTIQIIANEDAPLGQQPFLRLYAVGVLEDEPLFQGSCFLALEVVE